jgi:hypothetical protein
MNKRFNLPILGRGTAAEHASDLIKIALICAGGYFFIFIPVAYYVGLGTGIAEGAIHTLSK